MTCGSSGRSAASVSVDSIASTASMPVDDAAEDGVLAVQPGRRLGGDDEELGAVGVGAGVGHRQRAALDLVLVELVLEGVAGAAAAGALRAAALDHEVGDDAVEDEPVVEAVGGELAEVLDRLRRVVVVQLDDDRPGVGLKRRLRHGAKPYRRPIASRGESHLRPISRYATCDQRAAWGQPVTRTVTGREAPGA